MSRFAEIQSELNAITVRMHEVDDRQLAIEKENDTERSSAFTPELRIEYSALDQEFAELKVQREALEDEQRVEQRRQRDAVTDPVTPRMSSPTAGAAVTAPVQRRVWAQPRSVSSIVNFRGVQNRREPAERAYRFGQWCLARLSQQIGRYHNAFGDSVRFCKEQGIQNALHQTNDTTGFGHLVPEEFGMDLVTLREQYGVARRVLRIKSMSSDTQSDPRWVSGLTAYFVSEGGAGTTSSGQRDRINLVAKNLMVLTTMSGNLAADAATSIGDELAGDIAYAFADKEDDCAFNGDGTSTYGGITGIRTKLTGTGTAGVVDQATGNTWGAMVIGDFHNTIAKLPQYADNERTAWICHRTFYYGTMLPLLIALGGVEAREGMAGDRRPRPLFLGYPVEFSQKFPSTTAVDTLSATLGDYSAGARLGDRQQESIMFSEHATVGSNNVFETNDIAVRGYERFDINVHDAGDSSTAGPIVGISTGS